MFAFAPRFSRPAPPLTLNASVQGRCDVFMPSFSGGAEKGHTTHLAFFESSGLKGKPTGNYLPD